MFSAMNRFKITPDRTEDFEQVWKARDTHLNDVAGFVEFHLLKGPVHDDPVLYASHTIWSSREAFEAWTQSQAFRDAHANAGDHKGIYLGHPQFEGFEVVQEMIAQAAE